MAYYGQNKYNQMNRKCHHLNNIQLYEKKPDSKNYLVNINDIMLIKPIIYTICFNYQNI